MRIDSYFGIKLFVIVLLSLAFSLETANSQPVSDKRSGISFRIDDNQSLEKLKQFDSIFSKYGMKFCMSLIMGDFPLNLTYVQYLKQLQAKGHELMDHTPNGQTQYFNLTDENDTSLYIGDPGVDHFKGTKVCLKYSSFDTSISHNEGLVRIQGNMVISKTPGEFQNLFNFVALYFRQLNKICLWTELRAKNPNDVDTVFIQSFWEEPIDLGFLDNASYHLLYRNEISMSPDAIQLLGKRTLKICTDLSITRPLTWIQPGGRQPYLSNQEMKENFGDKLFYKQGASYYVTSLLCFNEYNPGGLKPFGMQYGETSIESLPFEWNKRVIANAISKNHTTIILTHFNNHLGDWNSFLHRIDSLLSWCSKNNIPVNTHTQWKAILYDYTPNGSINSVPKLNVDLDGDLFPDGFDNSPEFKGTFSTKDGVDESGKCCFQIKDPGQICSVSGLGGIQKGKNAFSIWTKAAEGIKGSVRVQFNFPETGNSEYLQFPVDSAEWKQYTDTIAIPDSISLVDLLFTNTSTVTGYVKISGMSLKTTGPLIVDFNVSKVCIGNTTTLISTSTPEDNIVSYKWDLNGDGKFDDASGTTVYYVFSSSGYHNVGLKITTKKGEVKAIYKLAAVGESQSDFSFENNCYKQPVQFINNSIIKGDSLFSYTWNFGDGLPESHEVNPSHLFTSPGYYDVRLIIETIIGCNASQNKSIIISATPTVSLQFSGDTIFYKGDSVIATIPSGVYDSVRWSTGSNSESITIKTGGTFNIQVYKNKCSAQDSFSTRLKEFGNIPTIMNLFTPNGDGKNDHWEILNLFEVKPCDVDVFNRFGENVLSEKNYQNDWDGLFHGKILTNDTYYYFVRCNDRTLYQGTVNILK